jgi:hypothetical protein
MPVVGFLNAASPGPLRQQIAAFREGLKESDYVEGQNVAVEYRWAEGQYDRLPALAAELVRRQVSVFVSGGGAPAVLAAKAATTTIPIVCTAGGDPIRAGFVTSLSRPGGNITGVYHFDRGAREPELSGRRKPVARGVGGGGPPGRTTRYRACQCGKRFHTALSTLVQRRSGALLVCASRSSTAGASSL